MVGAYTSMVLVLTVMGCAMPKVYGVPIGTLMRCGQPSQKLTREQKKFCCTNFALNCEEPTQDVNRAVTEKGKPAAKKSTNGLKKKMQKPSSRSLPLLRVRRLGQNCDSIRVRCATGLECRLGVCLRKKGIANLRHLVSIGKKVEEEERTEDADDEDDVDPLPAKEDFSIRGQSIGVDEGLSLSSPMVDRVGEMRASVLNIRPTEATDVSNEKENNTVKLLKLDKAASGIEEDEVAANIGDYLAAKGKKLNDKEWRTVRELIAGTLDERAQRDDEVDEVKTAVQEEQKEEELVSSGETVEEDSVEEDSVEEDSVEEDSVENQSTVKQSQEGDGSSASGTAKQCGLK